MNINIYCVQLHYISKYLKVLGAEKVIINEGKIDWGFYHHNATQLIIVKMFGVYGAIN